MEASSSYTLFKHRRDMLLQILKDENPEIKNGLLVLFGNFENDRYAFRQESSFYYLTGITEPGAVLFSYIDGREVLYLPEFSGNRNQWVNTTVGINEETAKQVLVDEVKPLGLANKGYSVTPNVDQNMYMNILNDLSDFIKHDAKVFTLLDKPTTEYFYRTHILGYLTYQFPNLSSILDDCSYIVDELRRVKDDYELDCMNKATQITGMAHEAAASIIMPGKSEFEIQAMIESVFTMMGASRPAFPSIVATGKNTTILHYMDRDQELKDGDLVVIDIGAEFKHYAADITRTYPVNGKFTDRQKEVYNAVLETQQYIESVAAPGMFINNPQEHEKSLHHLAVNHLKKLGYDKYFVHGIGHYLGLEVHDVGDPLMQLEEGVVITIEPGIYIPEENLGVRIEDDYVIVEGGCVQLNETLPKKVEDIEALMARRK